MSQRLTNILGYLTLFAVLAAIWVLFGEDPTLNQGARGEATFENLDASINEASEIRLTQEDLTTTLKRVEGYWVVSERNDFVAQGDKVRAFLRGLARSERREPKTASNDRFDLIGLGDKALNVSVLDGGGNAIAELKMGSRNENRVSGRSLTYIYKEGDTRSWLVSELAAASADPAWWLDNTFALIDESRVRSFKINDLTFTRAGGDATYEIIDTDGSIILPRTTPNTAIGVIGTLAFTDVERLANPISEPVSSGEIKTDDGLTLTFNIFESGGANWMQINASYNDRDRNNGPAGILDGAPENGEAEAQSIRDHVNGWLFRLEDSAASLLKRPSADYLPEIANTESTTPDTAENPDTSS